MRRWAVVLSALTVSLGAATAVTGSANAGNDNDPYTLSGGHANAGPMAGIVPSRGEARASGGKTKSPNLIYHGGPIQTSTVVQAIFWGSSWTATNVDLLGMNSFYGEVGGTSYLGTNTEYTNSAGAHVGTGVSYNGYLIDNSPAPSRTPQTSDILAEVQRTIAHPVANGYYPVYIDNGRGHAGYCAWHSTGSVSGVQVQFGFFFKLDGDPGCDPEDTVTGHSEGVAALGSVSGHELSEMLTDPHLDAWFDAQGAENADKCAWTFGGPVKLKGESWLIQGNWSNTAYDANKGYTFNGSPVRGCINGN